MAVYYILMALIVGLAYPFCIRKPSTKKNIIYVSIVFGYMFLLSIFRYGIGNDFYSYRYKFYNYISNGSFSERFLNSDFEPGYALIMETARLLGGDYFILNLIMAFLILLPVGAVIIKYSKMPWLSCWLYLTVTFFYNSLNFTRQSLAASIILLNWRFIKEKKHWAVVLITLAASLFHMSALAFIPIYFLSLIKPSVKKYTIIGAAAIAVYIFSRQILEFVLNNFIKSYAHYLDTVFLKVGLSPVYIIVPAIFAILAIAAYATGWKDDCGEAGFLCNMLFYNLLIWLFITKHFILERFTLPIYIFILISVPEIMTHFKGIRFGAKKISGTRFNNVSDKQRNAVLRFFDYAMKNGKRLSAVLTGMVLVVTVTYNDFCISQRVHGVFPYSSIFNASTEYTDEELKNEYRIVFTSKSLQQYLSLINRGNYTTVICANGNAGDKLDFSSKLLLKKIGVKTDLNKLDGKSFLGVYSGGKLLYEIISDEIIEEKLAICDNSVFITALSGGSSAPSQLGQVYIDGKQYTPDVQGLNFAVFDNDLKKIAASQSYDISDYDYTCTNTTAFFGEIALED